MAYILFYFLNCKDRGKCWNLFFILVWPHQISYHSLAIGNNPNRHIHFLSWFSICRFSDPAHLGCSNISWETFLCKIGQMDIQNVSPLVEIQGLEGKRLFDRWTGRFPGWRWGDPIKESPESKLKKAHGDIRHIWKYDDENHPADQKKGKGAIWK